MKANAVTPQARALQIVQSIAAGKLIATLTEAGIPDVLAEGPCDAGDIARAVGPTSRCRGAARTAAPAKKISRWSRSKAAS